MGSPVVHFEINSPNPAALHDFYRELFDWQIQVDPEIGYGMVDTKGTGINGGGGAPPGPHPGKVYIEGKEPPAPIAPPAARGGQDCAPPTPGARRVGCAA